MGTIDKLFSNPSKGVPLLKATVIFDDANNAKVTFEKLHPDSPDYEYVKLILHLFGKLLVNLDPDDHINSPLASELLISGIESLVEAKITKDSDILKITNIDDVVRIGKPKDKVYIHVAILYAISGTIRHIVTDLPVDGTIQQATFTLPIVIEGSLKFLDNESISILKNGLKFMVDSYRSGFDYGDLQKWETLPNTAFLEAFK